MWVSHIPKLAHSFTLPYLLYHIKLKGFHVLETKHLRLLMTAGNTYSLFKLLWSFHTNATNLLIFDSWYFFHEKCLQPVTTHPPVCWELERDHHKSQVTVLRAQPARKHKQVLDNGRSIANKLPTYDLFRNEWRTEGFYLIWVYEIICNNNLSCFAWNETEFSPFCGAER